jgi:hypothetical protein
MRLAVRFSTVVALLALIVAPMLACVVPRQLLNTAEHACCRSMGDECGSKKMPSPQSCCKSASQDGRPYLGSAAIHLQIASAHSLLALLPPAAHIVPIAELFQSISESGHSPPVTPAETTSILRI